MFGLYHALCFLVIVLTHVVVICMISCGCCQSLPATIRLLKRPERGSWGLRVESEGLIGSHFFRRADVISKLNSHSQVNAASRAPPVLRWSPRSCLPEHIEKRRRNKLKKRRTSPPETKQKDFTAETPGPEPLFLRAKAAELFVFFFFFLNCNHTKMNRSFNKSQPLRTADCNAVEVKSKVSVVCGGSLCDLEDLKRGGLRRK